MCYRIHVKRVAAQERSSHHAGLVIAARQDSHATEFYLPSNTSLRPSTPFRHRLAVPTSPAMRASSSGTPEASTYHETKVPRVLPPHPPTPADPLLSYPLPVLHSIRRLTASSQMLPFSISVTEYS